VTADFEAFAEKKEAEAHGAVLEPWVTTEDHHARHLRPIGTAWSRALFDGDFFVSPPPSADRPSASLVFVESRDGNTGARDPSALGGGQTDKHLIYEGLSRVAADAVLAGAETIRGGRVVLSVWRRELVALRRSLGLPRHPVQIVATLQGLDVEHGLMFNVPGVRVMIVTVPAPADAMRAAWQKRPWIVPIVMKDAADLASAFREIRRHGIETVSCIGGRRLARQLIDARLIQDLYLTTSPRPGGEPDTPLYPAPLPRDVVVRKRGTGADAGVAFEHSRLR
jgi:5-amino-6-(5-phosphoribosylamino)uracil reductase